MRDALAAILLLLFSTLFLAGMTLAAPVDTARTVAAVFPPWYGRSDIARAVFASGADLVRHGGLETVALLRLRGPEDIEKLKDAGALAVLSPDGLRGCIGQKDSVQRIFQREN